MLMPQNVSLQQQFQLQQVSPSSTYPEHLLHSQIHLVHLIFTSFPEEISLTQVQMCLDIHHIHTLHTPHFQRHTLHYHYLGKEYGIHHMQLSLFFLNSVIKPFQVLQGIYCVHGHTILCYKRIILLPKYTGLHLHQELLNESLHNLFTQYPSHKDLRLAEFMSAVQQNLNVFSPFFLLLEFLQTSIQNNLRGDKECDSQNKQLVSLFSLRRKELVEIY